MSKAHSGTKTQEYLERYMEELLKGTPGNQNSFKPYMKWRQRFFPTFPTNRSTTKIRSWNGWQNPSVSFPLGFPGPTMTEISGQIVVGGCNLTQRLGPIREDYVSIPQLMSPSSSFWDLSKLLKTVSQVFRWAAVKVAPISIPKENLIMRSCVFASPL